MSMIETNVINELYVINTYSLEVKSLLLLYMLLLLKLPQKGYFTKEKQ